MLFILISYCLPYIIIEARAGMLYIGGVLGAVRSSHRSQPAVVVL